MKKLIAAGIGIFIIILIIYLSGFSNNHVEAGNESEKYEYEYYYNDTDSGDDSVKDDTETVVPETVVPETAVPKTNDNSEPDITIPSDIDTNSDSITVFVNKEYALPSTFIPEDLIIPDVKFFTDGPEEKRYMRDVAAKALENMFADASEDCEVLYGVSGYRSYSRQTAIYNNNIRQRGSAATNQVSAVPGHSEHQTGLSIDISCKDLNGDLSTEFAGTSEGKWVADNCYKYGFIIRYPKNREKITGYTYEPWHIRYVGTEVATYIYDNDITFEEYFGYTPKKDLSNLIISDAATAETVTPYNEPESTPSADKDEKDNKDKDKEKSKNLKKYSSKKTSKKNNKKKTSENIAEITSQSLTSDTQDSVVSPAPVQSESALTPTAAPVAATEAPVATKCPDATKAPADVPPSTTNIPSDTEELGTAVNQ